MLWIVGIIGLIGKTLSSRRICSFRRCKGNHSSNPCQILWHKYSPLFIALYSKIRTRFRILVVLQGLPCWLWGGNNYRTDIPRPLKPTSTTPQRGLNKQNNMHREPLNRKTGDSSSKVLTDLILHWRRRFFTAILSKNLHRHYENQSRTLSCRTM